MMSDGHQDVNQHLEAISGRLASLLDQLAERREQSTTKAERKHLDRLRRDAKKQVSAIVKLQSSVHDANTVIAKSSDALGTPDTDSGRAPRQSLASDVNSMLFQAVAGPFQNQHRLRLVQQRRSLELSQLLKPWKQTKSQYPPKTREQQSGVTTATTLEQSLGTKSNDSGSPDTKPAGSGPTVEVHAEGDTPILLVPSQEESDRAPDSDSESESDPAPNSGSLSSSSFPSPSLQDRDQDQDQDWSSGHAAPLPPPLPRKSSRRMSFTPRVPSATQMPPLPSMPVPSPLHPLPLMPRTPPPLVPESASAAASFSSAASTATADELADDILSGLEKRYSLARTTTPPFVRSGVAT
ncbi:hypothetical protein PV04_10901 [Phialophora macrospora]|uniref:Uncharacterized protein n=1 Tax=Phialophora macrospora TaxID=1851006 RepID=A0A0D2DK23_9EURO|nr:hypothetical protein PV04_10901 [Phialophora macrospora]